jgi:uncharacterized protein (UPF0261 family)
MAEVGKEVARRLQHTKEDAIFLVPTAGYDCYSVEGQDFNDPEADSAFVSEMTARLPKNIRILERDTHIEDPSFATEAAQLLISLMEKAERGKRE